MRIRCFFFWAATLIAGAHGAQSNGGPFDLKVRLSTPFNRDFTMLVIIRAGEPFTLNATNGATTDKLSGILHKPSKGIYPVDLTISEWISAKENIRNSAKLDLELGKTRGTGVIAGLVYCYFVTLRRHEPHPR